MTLHPQIAAFAAQLDDLSRLLRAQGARPWADRIDLIQRAVADSNYAGVTRFLELFEGEVGFAELTLSDEAPMPHWRNAGRRRWRWRSGWRARKADPAITCVPATFA
ncbi:hypothetical protein ACFSUK_29270 [Sphingobium scionense]